MPGIEPEDRITVRESGNAAPHRLGDPFPDHDRVEVAIGDPLRSQRLQAAHPCAAHDPVATLDEVRILAVWTSSPAIRAASTRPRIENEHIAELVRKSHARRLRGQDRLVQAAPNSERLLAEAAQRGGYIGATVAALLRLLDAYGAAELEAAIDEALKRDVPHPNAVRLSLTRRRELRPTPAHPRPAIRECAALSAITTSSDTTGWANPRRTASNERYPHGPCPALGLHGLAAHWGEVAGHDWPAALVAWEEEERRSRSLKRRLGDARLGQFKPLADFDWAWPRRCDRMAVESHASSSSTAANVVLVGPNGVGKSTIAANIAHRAVLEGHTVRFGGQHARRARRPRQDTLLQRRLRFYARQHLLVIDEVGYLSYRHADRCSTSSPQPAELHHNHHQPALRRVG